MFKGISFNLFPSREQFIGNSKTYYPIDSLLPSVHMFASQHLSFSLFQCLRSIENRWVPIRIWCLILLYDVAPCRLRNYHASLILIILFSPRKVFKTLFVWKVLFEPLHLCSFQIFNILFLHIKVKWLSFDSKKCFSVLKK